MRIGLLSCFFALSVACNSKSDAEKFMDSYCVEVVKCCTQAGMGSADWMCHKRVTMAGEGGTYNPAKGNACLAEVRAQVSAGTFCSGRTTTPSCDAVYTLATKGTAQPGETCKADSDCAPSNDGDVRCVSAHAGDTLIQKCQVQPSGKAGDSCVGTKNGTAFSQTSSGAVSDVAPRAYVCDHADNLQCTSGTCVALADVGASCSSSDDCVTNAYCNSSTGLCAAPISVGGTCTPNTECISGAYCDSATSTCTAKVTGGKACSTGEQCLSDNCANGLCVGTGSQAMDLMCAT